MHTNNVYATFEFTALDLTGLDGTSKSKLSLLPFLYIFIHSSYIFVLLLLQFCKFESLKKNAILQVNKAILKMKICRNVEKSTKIYEYLMNENV